MIADERGRVPFAMIGVLVLLGGVAVAVTAGPGDPTQDPAVESVLDRTTATVNAELRDAATTAAEDAASAPVIEPANTSWGDVVNGSDPFRDSLEVRVYDETRQRIERIERMREDVQATASLPPTPNATALEDALDRVSIQRLEGNETAVTVGVENVTLAAHRDGRAVAVRNVSPSVTVSTPVLEMHDRVEAYEEKLNAGIAEPGLTQRLTAQITALAWARGWAQNRGAPIDNVVANHHVEVATNAAALDVQRTTIGHVDPDGLKELAIAGVAAAGQDLVAATNATSPRTENLTEDVAREIRKPGSDPIKVYDPPEPPAGPDDHTVVGVNRTADDRYLEYVEDGLEDTIESVYTAQTRLRVRVRDHRGGAPGTPPRPGPGWVLAEENHRTDVTVRNASGFPPGGTDDWDVIDEFVRDVEIDHERVRVWKGHNGTRRTSKSSTESATVAVSVQLQYGQEDSYWDRAVDGLYESGAGPLSGPNLAGIDEKAREAVVADRGGPDEIAARALEGTVDEAPVEVLGERPDGIDTWIREDLNGLRTELRAEHVEAERDEVASFETNPPRDIAERLREERLATVDPPDRFDGVADRARVAARAAYHGRVEVAMWGRASARSSRASTTGDRLSGNRSMEDVQDHVDVDAQRGSSGLPTLDGPDGPVRLRVDAAPSYLSLAAIDDGDVPGANGTEHPLVAQNLNLFSIPFDDVEDAVGNVSFGAGDSVRLETAARTLRTAEGTLAEESDEDLEKKRDTLRYFVDQSNVYVQEKLASDLLADYVDDPADASKAILAGLEPWNSTHGRALALSNGTAAEPIATAAIDRANLSGHEADLLRMRVDRFVRNAVEDTQARVPAKSANETATVTSEVTEEVFDEAIDQLNATSLDTADAFDQVPNGLPLAPVPGSWYATTNVWTVSVKGEYVHFGVRTTRAGPNSPGGDVGYLRDGGNVTIDLTDDGRGELFGRSTRVRFDAWAATAVLVPPSPDGVGDVEGDRNETSAGWPDAGPK